MPQPTADLEDAMDQLQTPLQYLIVPLLDFRPKTFGFAPASPLPISCICCMPVARGGSTGAIEPPPPPPS